ncbi:MCE family protein [Amycolatopsis jiangsuensis]|uniref:Phospholipid/cholesterol/gamma-HCH transport system substrate-binding protein n=1 Tax=Amycolatopsis jiangsuensis TaxID=1181879 RepID=A0A840J5M6_9PSEU|nr:MCE family protein [Amycolatopsis jiangsuensis]MBB4688708.1 phospholipid/cholesterol/gamma-HCH transport system substrate-binding protein [Amycolatopsis jiangsuensis]
MRLKLRRDDGAPRIRPFRSRSPMKVGLVTASVLLVLGLLTFFSDDLPLVGGGTTYHAEFTEAAGLRSGDEVRVAGVKVGEVTAVDLAGDHVDVEFRVRDTWVGSRSTASIKIKTLLGQKNLVLDPVGDGELDPDQQIPVSRTRSPYDVTEVFNDLAGTVGAIDTDQLANAFRTLSDTLGASAPQDVRAAFTGVAALSKTLASRDDELVKLFHNTQAVSTTLADRSDQIQTLIRDGNTLLGQLNARKEAIGKLFTGIRSLSTQLSGLVADNQKTLGPALDQLDRVAGVLQQNQAKLEDSLRLAGPYYRLLGNAVGNGRWIDTYLCGLIPAGGAPGSCVPPKNGGR